VAVRSAANIALPILLEVAVQPVVAYVVSLGDGVVAGRRSVRGSDL